jgi:energy-coupling factor transport system permease protein
VTSLDPITRLVLGLMAMVAVMISHRPQTIIAEGLLVAVLVGFGLFGTKRFAALKLALPMVALVFGITLLCFDAVTALFAALRLLNLMLVASLCFAGLDADPIAEALRACKLPHELVFILTAGLQYVPLMGQKLKHIVAAQQSRGIDLRPRLKNAAHLLALLVPLLIQAFLLSDELAMAMETRGFGQKGRTSRYRHRIRAAQLLWMAAGALCLGALIWWEHR